MTCHIQPLTSIDEMSVIDLTENFPLEYHLQIGFLVACCFGLAIWIRDFNWKSSLVASDDTVRICTILQLLCF